MSQISDKEKFRLLSEEVQSLLLKRVIEDIPLTQLTPGFYSRLFLVPKKTGGMRGTGNCSSPKGGVSNIQGGNNLFTRPRLLGTFKTSFLMGFLRTRSLGNKRFPPLVSAFSWAH
jgi:hypothetical protein